MLAQDTLHIHTEAGHERQLVLQGGVRLCSPGHVANASVQADQAVVEHNAAVDHREHEESHTYTRVFA